MSGCLADVSWVFEEENRREAALEVCDYDGKKTGGANSFVGKGCVKN